MPRPPTTNAAIQRRFKATRVAAGLRRVTCWLPVRTIARVDQAAAAAGLKRDPYLAGVIEAAHQDPSNG